MIRNGIIITRDGMRILGGPGSGNFGHAGISGQRGGSSSGGGGATVDSAGPGGGNFNNLSDSQQKAVKGYTGAGGAKSRAINAELRQNNGDIDTLSPEIKAQVLEIDAAIKESKVPSGTVFRGVKGDESLIMESLDIGDEYSGNGFMSSSKNEEWASGRFFSDGVVLEIEHPETNAVYMGDDDPEKEMLFGRNTRMIKTGEYEKRKELKIPVAGKFVNKKVITTFVKMKVIS